MIDRQADEDFGVRDEAVDSEVGVEDRADIGVEGNAEDLETIADIIDEHLRDLTRLKDEYFRDLAEGVERLKGELAPLFEATFADSAESVEEGDDTATEEDLEEMDRSYFP